MAKVFAFGTLKRGFPLHREGLWDARYLGPYRTVERWPMVIAGPWYAPMMLNQPGIGLEVRGELYEVPQQAMKRLDALESIGLPGNFRITTQVVPLRLGRTCSAQVFVKSPELASPLHTSYLDEYHDCRFIPPKKRPNASTGS